MNLLYSIFLKNETWILIFFVHVLRKVSSWPAWPCCIAKDGFAVPILVLLSLLPRCRGYTRVPLCLDQCVLTWRLCHNGFSYFQPPLIPSVNGGFPLPCHFPSFLLKDMYKWLKWRQEGNPCTFHGDTGARFWFSSSEHLQYLQALILVDALHDS